MSTARAAASMRAAVTSPIRSGQASTSSRGLAGREGGSNDIGRTRQPVAGVHRRCAHPIFSPAKLVGFDPVADEPVEFAIDRSLQVCDRNTGLQGRIDAKDCHIDCVGRIMRARGERQTAAEYEAFVEP